MMILKLTDREAVVLWRLLLLHRDGLPFVGERANALGRIRRKVEAGIAGSDG